jgi:hypothetical protein
MKPMQYAAKSLSVASLAVGGLALASIAITARAESLPGAPAAPPISASSISDSPAAFAALPGRWVRPDGGYVISIKSVDASGKLDASYANPNPLPLYTAVATGDGGELKVFFELRAGGYNGSTYTLDYDAAGDRLKGTYYQAVAKQTFEVFFVRK